MNSFPETINSTPWMLSPEILYLNHGSFGARPCSVFESQMRFKQELESAPVYFLDTLAEGYFANSRASISNFVGLDAGGIGFVDNATTGVSAAIHAIELDTGDEVLTTNHVYNGVRQLLKAKCRKAGCSYRECPIGFPAPESTEIVDQIETSIMPNTKVLIIDHVSSTTALKFPIEEIIKLCKSKEVLLIVDGAHAPGMLPLNFNNLLPDWYIGNCHKWVCAPLGAAFIWSSLEWRESTHPLTISHFLDQGYTAEFDWQGTKDITPWLTIPDAIKWGNSIGWHKIQSHNHQMASWILDAACSALSVQSMYPSNDSFGSMVTIKLPTNTLTTIEDCLRFKNELYRDYSIEIPVFEFDGAIFVRFSAQLYVQEEWIYAAIKGIQAKLGV